MNLPDLPGQLSNWLSVQGPESDVVISSRVRLARNLAGYPFTVRSSDLQKRELLSSCRHRILQASLAAEMLWVDLTDSSRIDRLLLVERHLISRQHSRGESPRGVAISRDETLSIMVNEEDHMRLQTMRPGLDIEEAYRQADSADDQLESHMDFAYSHHLGYLTACPTNLGTGIRVSVMLHLPALKLTGEIEKIKQAAKDMHLAIRGYHGEGTESIGDLFQVSNQTTLGRSETQILEDFRNLIIPRMIDYERRARQALADERPVILDDRIHRAMGILSHARMLGSEEALFLLSSLRLGICLNRIQAPELTLSVLNELMFLTQPAHLQKMAGRSLSRPQRREYRASYIRRRLGF